MIEKLTIWIAWHLPRSIVKWATIRVFALASATDEMATKEAGRITVFDALEAWNKQSE